MKISCEKCGTSYDIDAERIPPTGMTMKCTRCLHSFAVKAGGADAGTELDLGDDNGAGGGAIVPPPPADLPGLPGMPALDIPPPVIVPPAPDTSSAAAPSPPAEGKYYVRRTTGKVFGPFLEQAIQNMLDQKKLSGQEEISSDGNSWMPISQLGRSDAPAGASNTGPADLPGLPQSKPAGLADLPGLPQSKPAAAGLADLPGLPQSKPAAAGLTDLPGLPQSAPRAGQEADLPGLPQSKPPSGGADLPGLPKGGQIASTVLGHRPPAQELDLNSGVDPADGTPKSDIPLSMREFDLDRSEPGAPLELDLPKPKAQPADLPELPTPAAGLTDLPAPAAGLTDLPAPAAGLTDLPAPSVPRGGTMAMPEPPGVTGLPAPAGIADIPAPSQGAAPSMDLPPAGVDRTPSLAREYGEVDLDDVSGPGIPDLPLPGKPAEPDLPAADFDLPMSVPVPATTPAVSESPAEDPLIFGKPQSSSPLPQDDLLTFTPPDKAAMPEPATPVMAPADEPIQIEEKTEQPKASKKTEKSKTEKVKGKGKELSLPLPQSLGARIGIGVGALIVVAGVAMGFTDLGFFGLNLLSGDSTTQPAKFSGNAKALIGTGTKALRRDTYSAYRDATNAFASAAANQAGPAALDAKALQTQALAARVVRFNEGQHIAPAQQIAGSLATAEQPTNEIKKAQGMLALAQKKPADAIAKLQGVSDAAPADVEAAVFLGWAQLANNQAPAAKTSFSRALAADTGAVAALCGLARVEQRLKKAKLAVSHLKAGLVASPTHAAMLLLYAELLVEMGRTEEAVEALQKLAKQPPAVAARGDVLRANNELAKIALKKGENEKALTAFLAALKVNAGDYEANMGTGRLYFGAAQHTLALHHFTQASQQKKPPANRDALVMAARTQLAMGKALQARNELQRLQKQSPKDAEVRFLLGLSSEESNDLAAAIEHYNEAIKLKADYLDPYRQLSRVYLQQKKTADAFATLKQASTVLSGSAEVRNAMGEAYVMVGDLKKAEALFEEALAIEKTMNLALYNLASTLHKRSAEAKDEEAANDLLEKSLRRYQDLATRDPRFPGLAAKLGEIYIDQKKLAKAAGSFDQALKVDNPSVELRLAAARGYNLAGQYRKALAQCERVTREHPTNGDARALRAAARIGLGHVGDALAEIRQALQREKKAFYFEVQAQALAQLGRQAEAVEAYAEAIKRAPKRLDLRLLRAKLLIKAGAAKDGLKEISSLIKAKPQLAAPHLFLGIAQADLGKEAQAAAAFKAALKRDPKLAEAHYRLGQIHGDNRRFSPALSHLKQATLNSDASAKWRPHALYLQGTMAQKQGQRPAAISAYKEFLKVALAGDPMRPEAIKALEQLGVKVPKAPPKTP